MQTWVKPEVFKLIFCSFFYHSEPVRIILPFSHLGPQFNHLTAEQSFLQIKLIQYVTFQHKKESTLQTYISEGG